MSPLPAATAELQTTASMATPPTSDQDRDAAAQADEQRARTATTTNQTSGCVPAADRTVKPAMPTIEPTMSMA